MTRITKALPVALLLGALFGIEAQANTFNAASCSSSNVQTAINSASNGDTVVVPSGSCTWSAQVTISTGITLQGQTVCTGSGDPNVGGGVISCTDNTTITLAIDQTLVAGTSSGVVTITGFTFVASYLSYHGLVGLGSPHGVVGYRLHHNHFVMPTASSSVMFASGYGLIDHNYFQDTTVSGGIPANPVELGGDYQSAGYLNWQDATNLGSNQAAIVEQNYYTVSNCGGGATEGFYDAYYGAKVTMRFNTIVGCNQWGGHGTDSGGARSVVLQELYGNHVTNSTGDVYKIFGSRGGTVLYWGNIHDGTTSGMYPATLQYFRVEGQVNTVSWGYGHAGLNWTPLSATSTGGLENNATIDTLNASDWQAGHAYAANASIGPTSNNAGGYNFQNQGSSCTSGGTRPSFNQTIPFGTTSDGSCTWTNVAGSISASPNPGVAAGFLSTAPDTTCTSGANCTRYMDNTNGTYPFRDQPCVGSNQVVMPCYEWSNSGSQLPNPVFGVDGGLSGVVVQNRDYFDFVSSGFNGTVGVGSGTLASRPSTCTTGVAYWATDQGSWNQSGNGSGQGVLYQCSATNSWTAYYTPYQYPDPLEAIGQVAPPTNLQATPH